MAITLSRSAEILATLIKNGKARVLSDAETAAFFKPVQGLKEKLRRQLPPQKKPRLRF
ncbi:hypothetical protein [Chitinophaga filiformis]|uniref:Uncharacterized protein n=1 Tax=Chitinophaga filiformis TaxID=104663 RepID=A0ABY4HU16_CHIFI|nr:hypothetical protein [Chitinophaga filiformis]UPK66958.1 hypothetical protein MYF79_18625 [Chitinophaga filiformis]